MRLKQHLWSPMMEFVSAHVKQQVPLTLLALIESTKLISHPERYAHIHALIVVAQVDV
jgi:hypothetical protein